MQGLPVTCAADMRVLPVTCGGKMQGLPVTCAGGMSVLRLRALFLINPVACLFAAPSRLQLSV